MHKFRNEEGLTLIELLITLAVIAVVFAIAVPVFSNVLAVAEADAATAQQAALASFAREYATTDLSYDSATNTTTATLNGDVIATIKGDATSAGSGNGGGNVGTVYSVGTDFQASWAPGPGMTPYNSQIELDYDEIVLWNASTELKNALKALPAGSTVIVNGNSYVVRSAFSFLTFTTTTYSEMYMTYSAGFSLNIEPTAATGTEAVTSITLP